MTWLAISVWFAAMSRKLTFELPIELAIVARMMPRSCSSTSSRVYISRVPDSSLWKTLASAMRYEYRPNARSRTIPKSASRIVTGCCVPQRRPVWMRVEKK